MSREVAAVSACLALVACAPADPPPSPAAVRDVARPGIRFDRAGLSDEIAIEVPPATRSVAIMVRGADDGLYALAALVAADGVERVGLVAGEAIGVTLRRSYLDERIGRLGGLTASVRLGLFSATYPDRPGQPLPPGPLRFRIASDRPAVPVDVRVLLPADDGGRRLAINVIEVSRRPRYRAGDPTSVPWLAGTAALLGQAGVELRVGRVVDLADDGDARLTEVSEPQEGPTSRSAALALRGAAVVGGDGLDVFVVDHLPDGVAGWSLGTPGPAVGDTMYSGVVLEDREPVELGRVAAHEIAHYLGLGHVEDHGASGRVYPDALADTRAGDDNLMGDGRRLTRDQAFVLSRSPWLTR